MDDLPGTGGELMVGLLDLDGPESHGRSRGLQRREEGRHPIVEYM